MRHSNDPRTATTEIYFADTADDLPDSGVPLEPRAGTADRLCQAINLRVVKHLTDHCAAKSDREVLYEILSAIRRHLVQR